jgi:predicted molibdopterin-dependent oxidoreductase YjgC
VPTSERSTSRFPLRTENSDSETNCPEYKVTAVEVVFVYRKDAWQKRAQEERSIPKQQRPRKRDAAPAWGGVLTHEE